jgi:hypothetical protein
VRSKVRTGWIFKEKKMRKVKGNKKNGERSTAVFEKLEERQLYSVVMVNPNMNFSAAINSSSPGDTISFTPGTYTLQTNPNGAAATWPAGRSYQGNGATLALSGGMDTSGKEGLIQLNGSSAVTEFTGFNCTDAGIELQSGNFNVHDNTFQNTQLGIFVSGNSGHVDHNTFTNVGQGIYGYPGDNGTYNNNTINGTTGNDGIHLAAVAGNNTIVSGNVVTGVNRIPIELQLSGTGIKVTNNYVQNIEPPKSTGGSWMGLSIACGYSNGTTVTGNTCVNNAAGVGQGAAIEIIGTNPTVSNNVGWGYSQGILNGAQGSALTANGNTFYGGTLQSFDGVQGPIAPLVGNNTVLPISAMSKAPAAPNAGTQSVTSASQQTATPAPSPAIPAGITAAVNGQPGQVTVTAPAGSTIGIYASSMDSSTAVNLGKISGSSAAISGIPLNWQVTVTVTTGGTTYTLPSVQVLNSTISSSGPFNPAWVGSTPVATTAVTTTPVTTAAVTSTPVTTPVTTTPVTTTATASAAPTIPAGITATVSAQPGAVTVTAPAGSTIGIYASTLDPSTAVSLGTISGTSATIGGIPLNWQVTVTVTTGGTTYTLPAVQVLNSAISSVSGFNPVLAVAATVVATPAPVAAAGTAAATNFAATSPSSSEVDLSWTDNTTNQATYVLQRRATHGSTGFQTIATIAAGVNSFHDVHVNAEWEYDYRLVAVLSGVTSPTVAAHVQVQAGSGVTTAVAVTAPAAPTVLLGASPNSTEVDLSWVDNTGGTATYILARRATYGTTGFQVIATLAAGTTSFTDTNVSAEWQYDYYLAAVVPGGVSSAATVHLQVQPMLSLPATSAA